MIHREVRLLSLPLTTDFAAGHDSTLDHNRELVVVRLIDENDGAEGWGECAALNQPGYTPEWARGAFELLGSGGAIDPSAAPMAGAALEMAELDLALRRDNLSFADHLGVSKSTVPAGATIGLGPAPEVTGRARTLVAAGYTRLKLKITPDPGLDHVAEVREAFPDVEIQVDANGSFAADHIDRLLELNDLDIAVVEQPFAPDDVESLVALRGRMGAWVVVDEGARPVSRLEPLVAADAIDGVVVKPSCLGIAAAIQLIEATAAQGLAVSIGGMVESALGRRALAAFAARLDVSVIGDISPSSLWLEGDPWPDLPMLDGVVGVGGTPGIAPPPDMARLDAVTNELNRLAG